MATSGSMPLEASVRTPASAVPAAAIPSRHSALVRVTHWITFLCFLALLVSGIEIVISHPRFYWGETGNVLTKPLFILHIPSSRNLVPTGYGYVLPDQNGWSRYLHFQAAWIAVFTGLLYLIYGVFSGHFRRNLFPAGANRPSIAAGSSRGKRRSSPRPTALPRPRMRRASSERKDCRRCCLAAGFSRKSRECRWP